MQRYTLYDRVATIHQLIEIMCVVRMQGLHGDVQNTCGVIQEDLVLSYLLYKMKFSSTNQIMTPVAEFSPLIPGIDPRLFHVTVNWPWVCFSQITSFSSITVIPLMLHTPSCNQYIRRITLNGQRRQGRRSIETFMKGFANFDVILTGFLKRVM